MAEESAKLRIPYIAAAQAQKHVTHNEAMTLLDTLVQLAVLDKDLTAPPAEPEEGDTYIVAGSATGAWLGWDNRVARFIDGTWRSYLPGAGGGSGWSAWVIDEDTFYLFNGVAWGAYAVPGGDGVSDGDKGDVVVSSSGTAWRLDDDRAMLTVRAATTANITISTALNNTDTLDGVTLATGDLVLVKDQSTASQNGIYVVGVSPARDPRFAAYKAHPGLLVTAREGTANANTLWLCTSNRGGTIGSTGLDFAAFTGGGGGPVNLVPEGEWSGGATYAVNDAVSYEGSSYVSRIDNNTGNQPDTSPTQWMLLAEKGGDGAGNVNTEGAPVVAGRLVRYADTSGDLIEDSGAALDDFGDAAFKNTGTGSGDVAAGGDSRFTAPTVQLFTSSGTWNKPAGLRKVKVTAVGGGGGGGGPGASATSQHAGGGGGGGGGTAIKFINAASLGSTVTVTVGAGGSASSDANGGAGGTSSFGSHCSASGGGGAGRSGSTANFNSQAGNNGGVGSSGDLNFQGHPGGPSIGSGTNNTGGNGGGSYLGGGGAGNRAAAAGQSAAGSAGGNYGGGGGGGSTVNNSAAQAGGTGAPGAVIVEEFY